MCNRMRNTYTKHCTAVSYVHGKRNLILRDSDYFCFCFENILKENVPTNYTIHL